MSKQLVAKIAGKVLGFGVVHILIVLIMIWSLNNLLSDLNGQSISYSFINVLSGAIIVYFLRSPIGYINKKG